MISAHGMTLLLAMLQGPAAGPAAQPAVAQADSGSRIRITVSEPSKYRRVGRLVSWDADSLKFLPADTSGLEAVAIGSLSRLEGSLGRRSNAGRGAMIGALVGGGAGLILGIAASADNDSWLEVGPEEIALITAFMGATGAGLGALAGATTKRERWEPVTLPARIARQPLRPRSIAGARVTIGF